MSQTSPRHPLQGLTPEQVEERRNTYGRNTLTPPERPSLWKLYLEKFNDPIVRILLAAAAVSLLIAIVKNDFLETIGIFVAIFLSTGIAFYFERDAARRFEELNTLGEEEPVTVIRNGNYTRIPRSEVVVGDLVVLEQGMEVPADGTLLQAESLQLDESSLTGEPYCTKTADPDRQDPEATYPSNRVMRSTMVTEGNGLMEVTETGDHTEIGKVQHQATVFKQEDTPLNKQLSRLASLISRVAFAVALIIFIGFTLWGLYAFYDPTDHTLHAGWMDIVNLVLQNFMVAVTLIVMAVPEGLPMAITLSLALNMRRMLKTNNLVRKMHACETMGAINVICTDKTGTLTQNKMQVQHLDLSPDVSPEFLAEALALNTTAHIGKDGEGLGNPTECALLLWLEKQGTDYRALREKLPVLETLPFSTERKYMATQVLSPCHEGKAVIFVKGAPEIVLGRCRLTVSERATLDERLKTFQRQAMRTLAFAWAPAPAEAAPGLAETVETGELHYMGLAAIADPVRPEVPQAVSECREAGIRIIVVTGDTSETAVEIARRIGLWTGTDGDECQITGREFAALEGEALVRRVRKLKVISRARPLDKQKLVETLQKDGAVVAVTGDGTNDAPALNAADVGLAMGSGTSVAKEAGDITLLDDSFGSIATAVLWGRSIYRNIQRFLVFQLTINVVALLVVLLSAFVSSELPLTVTQMLWINLIMDTFAAMALAALPPDKQVMKEKPRRTTDFILTPAARRNILWTGALLLVALMGYFLHTLPGGKGGEAANILRGQTVFFNLFVLFQCWNLLNAKAFGTNQSAFVRIGQCKGLLWTLVLILVGQLFIVEMGGKMFRTYPLDAAAWAATLAASSLVLWAGETVRFIKRKTKS